MSCSDKQWAEIERVRHHAGVDADTVMIGKCSLRDELDRLAAEYAELANRKPLPTMKQLRDDVGDIIEKIDALRRAFFIQVQEVDQETGQKKEIATIATMYAGDQEAAELRGLLDKIGANLRSEKRFEEARDAPEIVQHEQGLRTEKRGSNASKDADDWYRRRLARIWQQVAPQAKRTRLVDFLVVVTGDSEAAIKTFVYRPGPKPSP